jgi:hypothetical protein
MTAHNFQPGDVAMVTNLTVHRDFIAVKGQRRGWYTQGDYIADDQVTDARPLVVIDPEDREQVERLMETLQKWGYFYQQTPTFFDPERDDSCLAAALREYADPTPPKEPTDPKARVTDRRENIWRMLADGDWVCTSGPDIGEYLVWWQLAERGPLATEGVS